MNVLCSILLTTTIMSIDLSFAQAGVVIGGTHVIFDGNKKKASISINNPDNTPYLVQSWIETPGGRVGKASFIVTPPLCRLNNERQNVERIAATGALPQDKESPFWLNVRAIPSASQVDDTLQIIIRTRIKLIYQPTKMENASPGEQTDKLH